MSCGTWSCQPKLVGLCPKPPALLMTRHGNVTFKDLLRKELPAKLSLRIVYDLVGVLEGLHAAGFSHNDIKCDNVMVSLKTAFCHTLPSYHEVKIKDISLFSMQNFLGKATNINEFGKVSS